MASRCVSCGYCKGSDGKCNYRKGVRGEPGAVHDEGKRKAEGIHLSKVRLADEVIEGATD